MIDVFVTTDKRMDVRTLACAAGEFDTVLDKGADRFLYSEAYKMELVFWHLP